MKSLPLPIRLAAGLAATAVERVSKLPEGIAGLPVTVASQALQLSMRVQQHVTELAIKGDEALAGLRQVEDQPEWATFDEDEDSGPTGDAEVHEFLRREAKGNPTPSNGQRWDVAEPSRPSPPVHPLTKDKSAVHAQSTVPTPARPETVEPETVEPDAVKPPALEPDALKPDAVDSDAVEPASTEPDQREQTPSQPEPSGTQHTPKSTAARQSTSAPAGVAGFDEMSVAQLRGKLRTLSLERLEELLAYERTHQARERFVTMLSNRVRTVREATD